MAKSIQEMIEEAVKNMITDGRIVIQDDSGEVIEDLTVAIDGQRMTTMTMIKMILNLTRTLTSTKTQTLTNSQKFHRVLLTYPCLVSIAIFFAFLSLHWLSQ